MLILIFVGLLKYSTWDFRGAPLNRKSACCLHQLKANWLFRSQILGCIYQLVGNFSLALVGRKSIAERQLPAVVVNKAGKKKLKCLSSCEKLHSSDNRDHYLLNGALEFEQQVLMNTIKYTFKLTTRTQRENRSKAGSVLGHGRESLLAKNIIISFL